MDTGIYIRAEIDGRWESVDVGDPRVPLAQVMAWFDGLSDEGKKAALAMIEAAAEQEAQGARRDFTTTDGHT